MMKATEAEAVVTVALMAALADGRSDPSEREQLKGLFESLAADHDLPSLSQVHQRVLLRKAKPSEVLEAIESDQAKQLAFEIAVCVADADGTITAKEQDFLDELERRLGLNHDIAVAFERDAEAVAMAEPESIQDIEALPLATVAPAPAPNTDGLILKYAILNGALELLPQNLATMAILPLQTRMVYAIGKQHGHTLGAGHIKEFIATLGIGATSQVVENFARKALSKFVKKTLGKTAATAVKVATGPMMTFATTYAIGRVAEAYYSGGRQLAALDLRSLFQRDLAKGKSLYEQHRHQVDASAASLEPSRVLDLVRGKATL
ncbi:MAG: DUF533 domain-containing protein [Planctomycetota bacterium]